jgi:hypothetical protein
VPGDAAILLCLRETAPGQDDSQKQEDDERVLPHL